MPLAHPIPSIVSDCSRSALEWDRFLALLSAYAQSATGRDWLLALAPSTDRDWIDRQHALVAEMRLLLNEGVRPSVGSLFDPSDLLAKSRIEGAALEAEEIRRVVNLAEDVSAWASIIAQPPQSLADALPELCALSSELCSTPLTPLVESLRDRILPDGSLTDDASPELRRIRREMDRQQKAIEDSLRGALRRFAEGGSTQDDLITIRGERFVIPVKAEWKRRVQGVVHGSSSSGQTVYVEPLETIELNNDLVRLLEDEQAEIHRIFAQMTRQIGQYAPTILKGSEVLAEVDTLHARSRFAQEYNCIAPKFSLSDTPSTASGAPHLDSEMWDQTQVGAGFSPRTAHTEQKGALAPEANLTLKHARHPLLEHRLKAQGGAIVPVSLALTTDDRQLIISGPNTGGKTVGLKTTGLLAIMAQSGVPVSVEEAVFPIFDAFLADIGDAQSIEQNLSTFSAHIVNLNRIAARADSASLVLLDELGSATDPEEGAALAVAIAEHFLHARCWSIISTHHTSLKVYAENTEGVINAAVGFNEQTLAPTYELRQGVPGASAGINIAARLGLAPEMVASARRRLSTQTLDIGRFLDSLHQQLREVTAERARYQILEGELKREKQRLEADGMKEWRAKVKEMEHQLASLLKDFEYQARETVKAIDDKAAQQKLSKDAERRIARLRREFAEGFNASVVATHTGADKGDAHAQPHIVRHISAGDTVKLKTLGKTATVQRQIDDKNFEVSVGIMKMRVARDEIAEVIHSPSNTNQRQTPLQAVRRRSGVSVSMAEPDASISWEINVIGRTADEAQDEVEKFLDKAFLNGLPRIRIIHGTGMGILRRTLREWLKHHPQVATVTEPGQNEGGAGATVVEFKE
ncbi:DNA mismatch repair protein MutS2 [Silvibacterium bohemicum]|uniref:Endonuclease MutS2 n=1 Tax=Silvibacterium bohemicum TaxID=1577686 RepID=A0A841K359_9BACT|nr:Smr/MutS family protein [Silvibacterium bohemicum]MBB6145591.1 DNA mismatch repair protein MutS2 [Silvibacterium bohemicum]